MANPARPWRLALTEAEPATVLAAMAAHDARVLRNQPRPPWQPTTSTTMEARSLESCERTLILAMNRPDPPRSETVEQVYADVRAGEAMFGDDGRDCAPGTPSVGNPAVPAGEHGKAPTSGCAASPSGQHSRASWCTIEPVTCGCAVDGSAARNQRAAKPASGSTT